MSAHHRQLIRYSLDHLQFLEEQVLKLDNDIAAKIREAQLEPQWQLLQTVPAIRETSAATILAETRGDMTTFPSVKHLSSWAGLCPGNNRSAGKNKSSRTTGGNPWFRSSLVECSWAATVKLNCFLREKFCRIAINKTAVLVQNKCNAEECELLPKQVGVNLEYLNQDGNRGLRFSS